MAISVSGPQDILTYYCRGTSATCSPLFVKDISERTPNFSLYPNPVESQLTILSEFNYNLIYILNVAGEKILSFPSKIKKIDISTLPKGFYTIQLVGEKNILTQKFIKQ